MNINITVRHTDISDQLKQYIEDKASKLNRLFNNIHNIQIIVDEEKYRQKVELLVNSPIFDITVSEEAEDVRSAFDKAFRVAEKSIRREKEKVRDAKKNPR